MVLPSARNTPAIERKIRGAAFRVLRRRSLDTFFEHGHWWVCHVPSGRTWDVVDAQGADTDSGFRFEVITEGDEASR